MIQLIAFYLPQFHPIPENDAWWGKGFTEWTNAAKAKPLFPNHYQPHIPADLGFYDLRVPETRLAQASLAREYGIDGFCYYHYWFAGKRILERPFAEVLASKEPDFPFCLCWANATWTGVWQGAPDRVLIEQTYPGKADHEAHFDTLLPAFIDPRYLRVEGKPVFVFFKPNNLPKPKEVFDLWRDMAIKSGLPGLHLVGCDYTGSMDPKILGLDACIATLLPPLRKIKPDGQPSIYLYKNVWPHLISPHRPGINTYPCAIHSFDNTPRSGSNGLILAGPTPEMYGQHLRQALDTAQKLPAGQQLVFLKSWNEWAEGNHLEPDLKFGHGYLQEIAKARRELEAAT